MSSEKSAIKQTTGKPKSWAKDKHHTPKAPSNYQGVPILRYVEGKESPGYLPWARALFKVSVEKFGVHAKFIKSGKRFKPLDGFDQDKSAFYENDDDDDSEVDSDDEDSEDVEVEDKKSAKNKSKKDSKKSAESAEQKAARELEELELRKARVAARVKLEIEDQKAIRTIDPQVFAFIMLTISDESAFALGNQKGWDKLEAAMDPFKLFKAIARLHFVRYNDNHDAMEEDVYDKLDDMRQGTHEALGAYTARFKDCVTTFNAIGLESPDEPELLRKYRKSLDKSRYSKLLEELKLDVESEIIQPMKSRLQLYKYLIRRVPDTVYSVPDVKLGTVFAMESSNGKSKLKSGQKKTTKDGNPPNPCDQCPESVPDEEKMHWRCDCPNLAKFRKWQDEQNKDAKKTTSKTPKIHKKQLNFAIEDSESEGEAFMMAMLDGAFVNAFKEGKFSETCIGLDSFANVSLLASEELATEIRELDSPRYINGIGGEIEVKHTAVVKDIGRMLYCPTAHVNALSQSRVVASPHLDLDYHKQYDTYTVRNVNSDRVFYFHPRNGCYICDLAVVDDDFNNLTDGSDYDVSFDSDLELNQMTESELRDMYSKREIEKFNAVRELEKNLAFPSTSDLIEIVSRGIPGNEVTATDVRRTDQVLGKNFPIVKGKTTRKKGNPIKVEYVPKHQLSQQTFNSDIMFVNKVPFLITVSMPLDLTLCTHLTAGKSAKSLDKAFRQQFATMASQGFIVKVVAFDSESAVATVSDTIRELGALCEQKPHGTHVEVAERKQRLIKERARCVIHSLWFKMSINLVVMLVYYCVSRINMMPTRRHENRMSSREAFLGRKLSAKDICLPFGEYVLVHEERQFTNTMEGRAQEAIAVLPLGNLVGSVQFFTIKSHRFITRAHWTVQPVIPDWVKENLNALAAPGAVIEPEIVMQRGDIDIEVDDEPVEVKEHAVEPEPHHAVEPLDEPLQLPAATEAASVVVPPDSHSQPIPNHPPGRNPLRSTRTDWKTRFNVFNISVRDAMVQHPVESDKSIDNELEQILNRECFEPLHQTALSKEQLKDVIPSRLFLTEKFIPSGEFDKLKSRLVAGGHKQDRAEYEDISSPTVSTQSVFMISALAAAEGRTVATVDITGAYLNADMPDGYEVLMRLDKEITRRVVRLRPTFKKFVTPNGTLIVRLNKALYGCIESAKLWYDNLCATFQSMGFIPNPYDSCVFNRMYNVKQCTACVHVDDIKITCADPMGVEDTVQGLTNRYNTITVKRGLIHSYLGMTFDYTIPGKVRITMSKYVTDLLEKYQVVGSAATPASSNLFDIDTDSKQLSTEQSEDFHSRVATLLYLVKRIRPDGLTTVAFLSTRINAPTEQDWIKLTRLLKYINSTKDFGIVLDADRDVCVLVYVDASYGVHADGKSHTGVVISLGRGAVFVRSGKQKIVTKSSTESELVGLSDSVGQTIWTRNFLGPEGQGYKMGPATVHEDNMSTIKLAEKGRSTSERTRHISIRYFFIKDRIAAGEIKIEHLSTKDMIADMLTKPLQGELFRAMRRQLLNWE